MRKVTFQREKLVVTSGSDLPQILTLIPDEYIRPDPSSTINRRGGNGIMNLVNFEGTAIGDFFASKSPSYQGVELILKNQL